MGKRRTTRVVQAVPITVSGIDALGQAFKERTSTIIINCHGCKYQSKHYVPKTTLVTMEIPGSEANPTPRVITGQVIWVQRPRTVRELFQIGIELDVPGNVWGVAFPPDDWFPVPEVAGPELPSPAAQHHATARNAGPRPVAVPPPARDDSSAAVGQPSASEEKVRILPAPLTAQLSMALARQVAVLVAEAKKSLHQAAQEAANVAVVQAVKAAREQIDAKIRETIEQSLEVAARKSTEDARSNLEARIQDAISRASADVRRDYEARLQDAVNKVVEQSRGEIRDQLEAASARAADTAAATVRAELAAHPPSTPADSAAPIEASAVVAEVEKRVEQILTLAEKRLDESLTQAAQAQRTALTEQGSSILSDVREQAGVAAQRIADEVLTTLASERQRAEAIQASLQAASAQADSSAARLHSASETTLAEARKKLNALLAEQTSQLEDGAAQLLGTQMKRILAAMGDAAGQVLSNFASKVEQQLVPQLERSRSAAAELDAASQRAEQSLRELSERMAAASDQALHEALRQLQERAAQLPAQFEQDCRNSLERVEKELEEKSTDTVHTTFESMLKSSDWYQKKAQAGMQASMERIAEQSTSAMRDRAGEISRLLASELDHYSRTYVEHAQGQLDDLTKEVLDAGRLQLEQAAKTGAAGFSDELQRLAFSDLERFRGAADQTRQQALDVFRQSLGERIDQGVELAKQRLEAQLAPLLDAWRTEGASQKREWLEQLSQVTNEAIDNYKVRLQNASNSWLVASAATLTQHSQGVLEALAKAAEARLRATCSQVFAGLGESLRQRLLGISSELTTSQNTPEKK